MVIWMFLINSQNVKDKIGHMKTCCEILGKNPATNLAKKIGLLEK